MIFTNRKSVEQQAELSNFSCRIFYPFGIRSKKIAIMVLSLLICLINSLSEADIYRFVTTDGVETFTDAPSDKSAKVVIKDQPSKISKKRKLDKKQKTHDISLNEIVQKAVSASLNQQDNNLKSFDAHLPNVGGTITSKVGMRIDPIDGKWRQHNGIDIAIPSGREIKPVAPGVVVYSGSRSGYGNTVIVEHDNSVVTLYAHNSRLLAEVGQYVTTDTTLALSGSTGRSTGPHLHFEAWQTGTNITAAFLPNSGITVQNPKVATSSQMAHRFRTEILSDGSTLFTNIPYSTH